jgi:hypothetical protein
MEAFPVGQALAPASFMTKPNSSSDTSNVESYGSYNGFEKDESKDRKNLIDPSKSDWLGLKPLIKRIYIDENMTLKAVCRAIADTCGFRVT